MGIKAGDAGADLGTGEVYFVFYTDKTKEEIYSELAELEKSIRLWTKLDMSKNDTKML